MSYDVRLVSVEYKSNYTSNIYTMLDVAFMNLKAQGKIKDYYNHWTDGLTSMAMNSRQYLCDLIQELKSNPEKYKEFNPKNGWGSYETCIEWLSEILLNWKDGYELEISW